MLKRYIPLIVLTTTIVGCSKDKLQTRPSIDIKDINATEFFYDVNNPISDLRITVEYSDKEGDVGGGIITYIRQRLNLKPITDAASNDKVDTIRNMIPDFPKSTVGDIELLIPGTFLSEDPNESDTMVFKILVQDIGGNISDTLTTPTIVEKQL